MTVPKETARRHRFDEHLSLGLGNGARGRRRQTNCTSLAKMEIDRGRHGHRQEDNRVDNAECVCERRPCVCGHTRDGIHATLLPKSKNRDALSDQERGSLFSRHIGEREMETIEHIIIIITIVVVTVMSNDARPTSRYSLPTLCPLPVWLTAVGDLETLDVGHDAGAGQAHLGRAPFIRGKRNGPAGPHGMNIGGRGETHEGLLLTG